MCIRLYLLFAAAMAVIGCSAGDRCQSLMDAADYNAAEAACQAKFKEDENEEALTGWINALGKLGRSSELPALLADLKDGVRRADAMMLAAGYLSDQGNQVLAQDYYLQSAKLFRSIGANQSLAEALNRSFNIAWRKSNHREALGYAAEALDVARRANDLDREMDALTDLFTVLEEVGSLGSAQHVMTLMKQMISADENASQGVVTVAHNNQGLLYMNKQQYGLAKRSFDLALTTSQGSKNKRVLRGINLNAVWANIKLGRLDRATQHMERAWTYADTDGSNQFALLYYQSLIYLYQKNYELANQTILRAADDPLLPAIWLLKIYYLAGEVADGLGHREKSIEFYTKSIRATENMGNDIGYDQLETQLHILQRESYEALFVNYFEDGEFDQALRISEQAKTRSFIQKFVQTDEPEMALERQSFPFQAVSDRIDSLQQFLKSMEMSAAFADRDMNSVVTALDKRFLLSFFLAEERLFAIRLSGAKLHITELEVELEELSSLIHLYKGNPDNQTTLSALGSLLFPEHILPVQGQHLYISPDGSIAQLAFASLRVKSEFLVERNSLSLVPSASALANIVEQQVEESGEGSNAIVFGDPGGDLPAAKQEAEEVAAMLRASSLTGSAASFTQLVANKNPPILHLATHSGTNHLGPWVKFADGTITAKNLMQERIRPKLAMLASCGSGTPHANNLWGSLGGVLLSNGTSSAVVTLWSVQDELAYAITSQFYAKLTQGFSSAESLALAQRSAIAQKERPSIWGAFTLMGVPQALSKETLSSIGQ